MKASMLPCTMVTILLVSQLFTAKLPAEVPPNIIVMLADDMGLGDTSAYQDLTGNSDADQIRTPQMERLARLGIRFSDAHTPSSRCSPTRYGLLTGRYPWRNRLKFWVLFGVQGDPMIERDRPTIASLMHDQGYATAMVGKWHVGLRYRQSDGRPADAWNDADLTKPMFDTPLDHGFDECWITSRSHGTSGAKPHSPQNTPEQSVGPGHIHGRSVVSATGNGKQLFDDGPDAYVLKDLGGRHSEHAIEFLERQAGQNSDPRPFFLYYASNSNHGPYTPDEEVGEVAVAGAGRSVAGNPVDTRKDFIYENDVALGRMLDFLKGHDDPRRPGHDLLENTLVIFTSDNGADNADKTATGPWRSNKGSVYEGGHRVPFIAACAAQGIGDGDDSSLGATSDSLICLTDLFSTCAELSGAKLPDWRAGEKGGEDSMSIVAALQGREFDHGPMFYHDHKEADDPAAGALRLDDPVVDGQEFPGKWKLFFDARLFRAGETQTVELFELATDPLEETDRLQEPQLAKLVEYLVKVAERHRNSGGHRLANLASDQRVRYSSQTGDEPESSQAMRVISMSNLISNTGGVPIAFEERSGFRATFHATGKDGTEKRFNTNPRGVGINGGMFDQVDEGEAIVVTFNQDIIVESAAIVAGNGQCGGFYQVGDQAPLAIYCIDADIDAKDQSGKLSDIGLVKKGVPVRFDSSPHYGIEAPGRWRLANLTVRILKDTP